MGHFRRSKSWRCGQADGRNRLVMAPAFESALGFLRDSGPLGLGGRNQPWPVV